VLSAGKIATVAAKRGKTHFGQFTIGFSFFFLNMIGSDHSMFLLIG